MTLLDDLQALDLSGILDAKASIAVAVDGEAIQALVADGAAQRVLGGLGDTLASVREGLDDPAALLEPVRVALAAVVEAIGAGDLPLGEYAEAVTAAARIVAGVLEGLGGDPGALSVAGGGSLGDVLAAVGGPLADYAGVAVGEIGRFRSLMETLDGEAPTDPSELVRLALEVVLPFPQAPLRAVRTQVAGLTADLDRLVIDPRLVEGLVTATLGVEAAVQTGDPARVQAALDALARVRASTVEQLAAALRRVVSVLSGLRLDGVLAPVAEISSALRTAEAGVLDTLEGWRGQISEVRDLIAGVDVAAAMGHFQALLRFVEQEARARILPEMDRLVGEVEAWLRGLFRELPLRALRHEVTLGIRSVADAVTAANIDRVADAVREVLTSARDLLAEADLGALVGEATAEMEAAVTSVLDQVEAALGVVTAQVEAVADTAAEILGRALEGLTAFRQAVDAITGALSEAGIEEATEAVVSALQELRATAEELLSVAPIPDSLRGTIEQLASTLESVDLDEVVGGPLRAVAAQLRLPDDLSQSVTGGLTAMAEVVTNLVPANLTAELEAAVSDVLDEVTNLDLAPLTAGVSDLLAGAASFLEGISVVEAVEPVAAVFDQVLEAVDRVQPRRLLDPVIQAYNSLLGAVSVPDPDTIATRTAAVTATAGEAAARVTAEPVRRMAGPGATLAPARGAETATAGGGGAPAPELPPDDLRPGDVIRMIGYLPGRLREALQDLDAGPAGQVVAEIDGLSGGLADELAGLRDRLLAVERLVEEGLDQVLAPLAPAQVRAQLALQVRASSPEAGIDVDASLDVMAGVGPAALRRELAGELGLVRAGSAVAAASLASAAAADLDDAVELLRASPLARLGADLDAFLAALDPEPIAAEFDAMVALVVDRAPGFIEAVRPLLTELQARVVALVGEFNPATLAQRYLRVLAVLKEELDLVDPGRLADELGEVHAAIRAAVAAYDPRVLAAELDTLVAEVAAAVRGLDPAALLPDLSGLEAQVARVTALVPTQALDGVGTQLAEVGAQLTALDVDGLLDTVNGLAPALTEAVVELVDAVQREIVTLLRSIRYAGTSASASVSVSGSVG